MKSIIKVYLIRPTFSLRPGGLPHDTVPKRFHGPLRPGKPVPQSPLRPGTKPGDRPAGGPRPGTPLRPGLPAPSQPLKPGQPYPTRKR